MHHRSIDDATLRRPSGAPPPARLPEAAELAASIERYAASLRARGCRGAVRLRLDVDAEGHPELTDVTARVPGADAPAAAATGGK